MKGNYSSQTAKSILYTKFSEITKLTDSRTQEHSLDYQGDNGKRVILGGSISSHYYRY